MEHILSFNQFINEQLTFKEANQRVRDIQAKLNKLGFNFKLYGVDGKFGKETLFNIQSFFDIINNNILYFPKPSTDLNIENNTLTNEQIDYILNFDEKYIPKLKQILNLKKADISSYGLNEKTADYLISKITDVVGFMEKIKDISNLINCDIVDLIKIIYFETKGTFDPSITNSGGYVGLIQFGQMAAADVNTTTSALKNMNIIEQLDYVKEYLVLQKNRSIKRRKMNHNQKMTLGDLYTAVFYPQKLGDKGIIAKSDSTISKQNPALSKNGTLDIHYNSLEKSINTVTSKNLG